MKKFLLALLLVAVSTPAFAATWFVRADGGPIFYSGLAGDSCDGLADTAMTVSGGANQHCAVMDFRYLYDTGQFGNWVWRIAGGDTVVIRGCKAASDQQNPDNPHCRIGYDTDSGSGSAGWCAGSVSNRSCSTPNVPSGTAGAHTKILGACAYGTYTCNPVNNTYPLASNNLTQIFGGFAVGQVIALAGSQYVDIEGIELTAHNSGCVEHGVPAWPKGCVSSPTADDYASQGLATDAGTTNLLLQDVYIHGFSSSGIFGPMGAGVTLTRVSIDFNGFAGFDMDNGGASNGASATLTQSYVTMIGNGCNEEYPIVHTQFPAKSCYDTNSAGFGDSWSGQTCSLSDPNCAFTSFTCDHCFIAYNTKDGAMGPHVPIVNLSLTNSFWAGNKGAGGKWGIGPGGTFKFQNNIFIGNCERLLSIMPGAAQSFNIDTGLNGSYLGGCRGNDMFAYNISATSTSELANNTFAFVRGSSPPNQEVAFDLGCTTGSGTCTGATLDFTNDIFLGYPSNDLTKPALFFTPDGTTETVSHNVEFNMRSGETCGVNGVVCSDPLLLNEPALGLPVANMDVFNPGGSSGAHLTSSSPAINAGTTYTGQPTTDYYSVAQTSPLTSGAVVFGTAATPTFSPVAGTYTGTQSVTISSTTAGATLCYTIDGTTPTANGAGTCTHGTTYSTPVSVSVSLTLNAIASKSGDLDSAVGSAAYTITIPGPATTSTGVTLSGVTIQ